MSRWPLLAVFSILPALGCATASPVRAGLANAPALGTPPSSDERVRDVVANGDDGCEASGQSPLWAHTPPCNGSWSPGQPLAREVRPSVPAPSPGLADPWVNHFYFGWPCPPAASERQTKAFVPVATAVASCSVP